MDSVENGAVIIGLTQVVKGFNVKKEFLPAVALIIGMLLVASQKGFSIDSLTEGLITGLVSTGAVNKVNEFRDR